jgi:hypothetical protein
MLKTDSIKIWLALIAIGAMLLFADWIDGETLAFDVGDRPEQGLVEGGPTQYPPIHFYIRPYDPKYWSGITRGYREVYTVNQAYATLFPPEK